MARDCIKRIVEQSGGLFSPEDAKKLLQEAEEVAKAGFAEGLDRNDAIQQLMKKKLDLAAHNLVVEKQNAARNILLRREQLDKVSEMVEKGLDFKDVKYAMMTGVNAQQTLGRLSFEQVSINSRNRVLGALLADLERADLLDFIASDKFESAIETELFNMNNNKDSRPITGNQHAFDAAKIIRDHQEALRKRLNYYGADIGKLDNYSTYRTHDPVKMRKMGEDGWVSFVTEILDTKRSFEGDSVNLDKTLRDTYNALVTGVRLDSVDGGKGMFQFKGPGNLAKKLSHQRQLHFKSAEAEMSYRKTFSRNPSFKENLMAGFENGAMSFASLKTWGTNPEAMIEKVVDDVGKKYRNTKDKKGNDNYIKKFDTEKNKTLNLYKDIMGHFSSPDSIKLAQFGSVIRTIQNFKLGTATVASVFGDSFTKALAYNYNGRNIFSSYAKALTDLKLAFQPAEQRRFATMLSVATDSYRGDIAGRFTLEENLSSSAQKINRIYFKLNLLTWWTRVSEVAFARSLSADMALHKGGEFAKIPNADVLRTYGIDEHEWKVYQKTIEKVGAHDFINPQSIDQLPDSVLESYKTATGSKKTLPGLREDLRSKVETYFADQASFAVPKGGARERQLWLGGSKTGTAEGEFRRFIAQFKQQPTVVASRIWGRALYGRKGTDLTAIMHLMMIAPVFGYLQGAAKDMLAGKDVKDPTKINTIIDAMGKGGGLSILGETALNFASDSSAARVAVGALGPAIGDSLNLIDAIGGDGKAAQKLVGSLTPNLFYTNLATQFLFAHQVKNWLNPGYLDRTEENMNKYYNQGYYLKPK